MEYVTITLDFLDLCQGDNRRAARGAALFQQRANKATVGERFIGVVPSKQHHHVHFVQMAVSRAEAPALLAEIQSAVHVFADNCCQAEADSLH